MAETVSDGLAHTKPLRYSQLQTKMYPKGLDYSGFGVDSTTRGGSFKPQPTYQNKMLVEDERALVQLFYEMILNEKQLEDSKIILAEQIDFNTLDGF